MEETMQRVLCIVIMLLAVLIAVPCVADCQPDFGTKVIVKNTMLGKPMVVVSTACANIEINPYFGLKISKRVKFNSHCKCNCCKYQCVCNSKKTIMRKTLFGKSVTKTKSHSCCCN